MIRRVKEETGKDGAVLKWAFPGGRQRITESRSDCVRREILIETGYDVKYVRQISLRLHPQFHMYIAYHLCTLNSEEPVGPIKELHEVAEIKWVKSEEIQNFFTTDLEPGVKKELGL